MVNVAEVAGPDQHRVHPDTSAYTAPNTTLSVYLARQVKLPHHLRAPAPVRQRQPLGPAPVSYMNNVAA